MGERFETYEQALARLASAPSETKVVDIRTRAPFYPPGSLGATLKAIAEAFPPAERWSAVP
ncbi:hypothetical protein UP09_30975 [Bradyrhizobium sp. LTSP885]|uniref:hypothetical protein n=1 Tax=Bradyrhizobium sp. LTSP885 TaxID=1619232 RepID=UPI0005C7FBCC|nr:hypothetical protein [Bradyrhizobium sp. LTSP885]KJC35649.1 hypothetical protein UP09_30975 [Bradyrhizobium sp. LTSP885]